MRRERVTSNRVRPATVGAGLLLVLLGAWGGIVPFVGPYFSYGYAPNQTWFWANSRLWMNVLPGAVIVLGGLMMMGLPRLQGRISGAWFTVFGGAWLVLGPELSRTWNHGFSLAGLPMGSANMQVLDAIGFYYGLGVLVLFVSAVTLGAAGTRPRTERVVEPAPGEPETVREHHTAA